MKNVLIIGDSHITPFKNKCKNNIIFRILKIGGASAQGLTNFNSKQGALKKIIKFFTKNKKKYDYVILCFGEVDCNATIWHYKDKYNQKLEEALSRSVNNYFEFIQTYVRPHFSNNQIIIFDPILPTISDEHPQTYEIRKGIIATQKERTALTDNFSLKLKELSAKYEYHFLSLNNIIRNKDTGLIDKMYIKNPLDHHLPKRLSFDLWTTQLSKLI